MTVREWFRIQRAAQWARDESKPLWDPWSGADLDGVVTACLRNSLPADGRWRIGSVSAEPDPVAWLAEQKVLRQILESIKGDLHYLRTFPPVLL